MKKNKNKADQENKKTIDKAGKIANRISKVQNLVESLDGMEIKDISPEILKSPYMHTGDDSVSAEGSAQAALNNEKIFEALRTIAKKIGKQLRG